MRILFRSGGARRVALALGFLVISANARAEEARGPLRMDEAVQLALKNNERARKAPFRVEQAEGSLDRARGAFFPTIQAAGTGTLHSEVDKAGRIVTTQATATLSQPLITLSAFPLYSQASHQRNSERYGAQNDLRVLAFDTARAFLQTLASERVLEAASRRLDRARANVQNAEARAATQLASVNDVTKARLELTSSQREMTVAQGSVTRAYLQLGFLVGRAVTPPLASPDRTTQAAQAFEASPQSQVTAALGRRADVLSAHERTEALRSSAAEPLYRLAPQLTAQGQIRVLPDPLPSEKGVDETGTLNLVWTIFDAGFRYADRRTRVAQAESQALDESLLRRSVETDIATALVSLRAARDTFKIAEEAVDAATKNSEETEILYRQGLARALELTDANAKRFDAEVSRASAKLSMEQAYLELRYALGFGPLDETEGTSQ